MSGPSKHPSQFILISQFQKVSIWQCSLLLVSRVWRYFTQKRRVTFILSWKEDFIRSFPSFIYLCWTTSPRAKLLMKMSLISMKMNLQMKCIFIRIVSHGDSFWHKGREQLGNGLLASRHSFSRTSQAVNWLHSYTTQPPRLLTTQKENNTTGRPLKWSNYQYLYFTQM